MLKKKYYKWIPCKINAGYFFILISSLCSSCKTQEFLNNSNITHLEYPNYSNNSIIEHFAYSLQYDFFHKQASWVAYVLTPEKLNGSLDRKNNFKEDPKIKNGSAQNKDYSKSGFDKGHLAPAADMNWSIQAMEESFYLSNICPQNPSFNRGIWKKLENSIREWTSTCDSMYIVTGPILEDSLSSIGMNRVSVPNKFYKVLLRFNNNAIQGAAFILNNEKSNLPLDSFIYSIDHLEHLMGMDFFYQFDDSFEDQFENKYDIDIWFPDHE